MGRPKGSRNKAKTNGEAPTEAPDTDDQAAENPRAVAGHNDLTDDQRKVIFFQHKRRYVELLARKKDAEKVLKKAEKAAKDQLGGEAVKDIKIAIEAETAEGEASIKERVERHTRILSWMGTAVQLQLFPEIDLTPALDRARAAGKLSGMEGETCYPPHDPSVPQYQAWIDGWQDGQELLVLNKIRPLDEPASALLAAEEIATRDAARLAEHDAESDVEHETVDEAQDRLRQGAAMDTGLAGLVREQAATLPADDRLDIPPELDRTGGRDPSFRVVN
jgi:hypothetical protein